MTYDVAELRFAMVADLERLFSETITDTFRKNGIDNPAELRHEIEEKVALVHDAVSAPGRAHFLVALVHGRAVGIAGTFPVSQVIRDHLPHLPENQVELGAVYIRPSHQRQGIAQELVGRSIALLAQHGVDSFVLDCGYRTSQRFWRRLFGEPTISLASFFGEDQAYEIWHLGTDWALNRLNLSSR